MKKRELPKDDRREVYLGDDAELEMLLAAAEAHPSWEIMLNGAGIRHLGREGPDTPRGLLEWFLKKGRH
jgi:hypothetical protein